MRRPHPDLPFAPRRLPFFYGWVIVVVSTLGVVVSIPGQTMGVSVFTDPLIAATGLSRFELSNVYLVGTFASGLLLPLGGRWLDRFGARRAAVGATLGLAFALLFLSATGWLATGLLALVPALPPIWASAALLCLGFTMLRFSGQGMLTMVSRTMVARWWQRYRGRIAGVSGIFVSFGFASAPLLLHAWVEESGWRQAWREMAIIVGFGMSAIVLLFYRDTPEECGLAMDGAAGPSAKAGGEGAAASAPDATRGEAIRTLAFWVITLVLCNQSMVITAMTFHIVDIGAENGLEAAAAVGLFLPVAIVSTSCGVVVGWAIDRVPMRWLLGVNGIAQVVAFSAIANLGDPTMRGVAIVSWGVASSFFGPLTVAALPLFFGRLHLGAISSVQMMCLVVASAIGPSLLAASREWAGSYAPALYACCLLPVAVIVLAFFLRAPGSGPAVPAPAMGRETR